MGPKGSFAPFAPPLMSNVRPMLNRIYPQLRCRGCNGSSLQKLPREMEGGDFLWMFFGDWPFWLLFGLCLALGMRNWAAGLVAFGIVIYLYFAWSRTRSGFKCRDCGTVTQYADARRS
jgi:hypothetical protein